MSTPTGTVLHHWRRTWRRYAAILGGSGLLGSWIFSGTFHLALFFVLWFAVFRADNPEEEVAPTAQAQIVGDIEPPNLDASPDPEFSSKLSASKPVQIQPRTGSAESLRKVATNELDFGIIGIGPATGPDAGGQMIPLDMGLDSEFFGVGGSATGVRKVVYVVDRSASMLDTFAYVKAELIRSIRVLRRSQKFHVIFFNSGVPLENPPKRLVSAIAAHKGRFFEFLDKVVPNGQTRPVAALQRALSLQPDVIYFLSDGNINDLQARDLPQLLDQWNPQRRTRIFTIAYLEKDGIALMRRIAREHNGEFRFVGEHDLP